MSLYNTYDFAKQIHDFYETFYISRSIVVCKDIQQLYHLSKLLEKDDFPLQSIVNITNLQEFLIILDKFHKGHIRMICLLQSIYNIIFQPLRLGVMNNVHIDLFIFCNSPNLQINFLPIQ